MTILAELSDAALHEDREAGVSIRLRDAPSAALIELLKELKFGNDGLEYRRLNIDEQLARLPSPAFIELTMDSALVGSYMLSSTSLEAGGQRVQGIYRGLLGLRPEARARGLGRKLVETALSEIERRARETGEPVLTWGCIESANRRSMGLLKSLGAQPLAELESLTVFRQWPRRRIETTVLDDNAGTLLESALGDTYADCALRTSPGRGGVYHAVVDDGGIVAGARASLTRVDMSRTGSFWDTAWQGLLRFIPPARRRFDPANFRYLRLSDVVVRAGAEGVWRDLLTTLLAEHEVYLAMFVLDPNSRARARLGDAELFGRFTDSTRQRVRVLAHSWNLDPALEAKLQSRPLAIGPLDL
jgi:GNAT superfamily N-acetyltransferase